MLDRAGQAVIAALPEKENADMADDRQLREFTCDPKQRKVLVTDGKTALGQALVKAFAEAGAEIIWVGHAEPWKKFAGFDELQKIPQVTLVPLDVTDSKNVREVAAEIGGKVDILVNNAEHHRGFGIANRQGVETARAEMDVNYFGCCACAGVRPGDALARRRRPGERGGLGQPALDLRARQFSAARHVLGVEGRRAFARAVPARRDAPGGRARGERVPRADRRRVEPVLPPPKVAPAALARRSSARCRTASRTSIPATWRRSGSRAGATIRRRWNGAVGMRLARLHPKLPPGKSGWSI